MKTYPILVSTKFPSYHKRNGENTYFREKILNAVKGNYWPDIDGLNHFIDELKLHTCRANYELWEKRIKEVQTGMAVISLRFHTLGRYVKGNKQIEFCRLDKCSGVGVQKLEFYKSDLCYPIVDENTDSNTVWPNLHINDGLEFDDFKDWFKPYDLSEPMAIIHFTNFRY